jgi:glycosyltransferase involved in cell wall biosynthesis
MITTNTRGLSKNRNMALAYATAEYVMFADDDQVMVEGYEEIIKREFEKCPDADAIKFYCESTNKDRPLSFKRPEKLHKASKKELMSSGVPCLVIKRDFLVNKNIYFQTNLGPGAEYIFGEDSAFFSDIIAGKAKIYVSPILLSYINQGVSSWFKGYNEIFFKSLGYVYSRVYGRLAMLAIYRRALRLRGKTDKSFKEMVSLMRLGAKQQR